MGLSYRRGRRPHTHVTSSNNNAAGTCKKQLQRVLKAMPSRHMSSQAEHSQAQAYFQLCLMQLPSLPLHVHRSLRSSHFHYVRPAYQPNNDCPKPSKHTLQISTTRSHCRHQATVVTDPQLRSISCIKRIQLRECKEWEPILRLSKTRCQHKLPQRIQATGAEAASLSADQELCRGDKLIRSSAAMHKKG